MTTSILPVDVLMKETPAGETRLATNFKRLQTGEIYEVEIKIYFGDGNLVILSPVEFCAVTGLCAAVRSDATAWNRIQEMRSI